MTTHTAHTTTNEDNHLVGSIYNIGDRVVFKYYEDEDGVEYGYGTLHRRLDENTAEVKVVLQGRKKPLIDYHQVPFAELMPHIPDKRRHASEDDE